MVGAERRVWCLESARGARQQSNAVAWGGAVRLSRLVRRVFELSVVRVRVVHAINMGKCLKLATATRVCNGLHVPVKEKKRLVLLMIKSRRRDVLRPGSTPRARALLINALLRVGQL